MKAIQKDDILVRLARRIKEYKDLHDQSGDPEREIVYQGMVRQLQEVLLWVALLEDPCRVTNNAQVLGKKIGQQH